MLLRRAAAALAPKLLRNSGTLHSVGGAASNQLVTTATCGGDVLVSHHAVRPVTTSASALDKAGDSPDDGSAAARRVAVRCALLSRKTTKKAPQKKCFSHFSRLFIHATTLTYDGDDDEVSFLPFTSRDTRDRRRRRPRRKCSVGAALCSRTWR